MAKKDNVNHPKHYTSDPSGIECIDITRHRNFNVGNAIKYLWRAGLKIDADKSSINKQIEDLEKAVWYIVDEIHRLGGRCTVKTDSINTCLPIDNESIIEAVLNYHIKIDNREISILGLTNGDNDIKSNINTYLKSTLLDLYNTIDADGQIKLNM
ncbi:hypothetical protein [uncultured phage cr25_1]|uniref:DUF3310 domain-containing protein n=1 Tax=uncultured phage cr25_1 TaxID=2986395 RepID=A0AAE7RYI0_9CAUD|nr:hypothetical protein M1M55_gp51 [uncultured phage cr25_1]QWM90258.1 hypothetical protein [uncultured phage cr25_1]